MDFIAQLQALLALVAQIQSENVDLAGKLEEAKKAAYDQGFADGVASVPVGQVGFTQEQVDAMIAVAVEPLQKKIAELEEKLVNVDQVISDKVVEFKAAFKAEILAKLKEVDAAEDEAIAKLFE
jgi:hypothetical protein